MNELVPLLEEMIATSPHSFTLSDFKSMLSSDDYEKLEKMHMVMKMQCATDIVELAPWVPPTRTPSGTN